MKNLIHSALPRGKFSALILFSMLLAGCIGMPPRPVAKQNPIKADPELIQYVKSKGWLEKNCNAAYGYASGKWEKQFQQCVLVQSALMNPYDPKKADHFGKDYDPEKYYKCRSKQKSPGKMNCRNFQLVRNEPESVWPYADVPPIKWPDPPEEQVYYPGISPKEYYAKLCQQESGHFIYKTVDNVQGVYQVRPQYPERDHQMRDPYVM
ncbi:MAG: hypothetical protein R3182_13420, partial [Draconibacterium sp.]|nr:hypothetical protein [Draconibacterium sp.]